MRRVPEFYCSLVLERRCAHTLTSAMLESEGLQELCSGFVSRSYVTQGAQELATLSRQAKDLLSRRRLPDAPWPEPLIERLLSVRFMDPLLND
jgi:hypothetical protein